MVDRSALHASKSSSNQFDAPFEFIPGRMVTSPGSATRLSELVERIKSHENYTEAIGRDLGIFSSKDRKFQPVKKLGLTIERNAGRERVKILFTKNDHDGISLESRRNNGDWEVLCVATTKPCYDERPLLDAATPEVREYRANWWDKDKANGNYSPVQSIAVAPLSIV